MDKLAIAIPCGDRGIRAEVFEFIEGLRALLGEERIAAISLVDTGSLVFIRNTAIGKWFELTTESDTLLCLDSDNWLADPADALPFLHSDADVSVGIYPSRRPPFQFQVYRHGLETTRSYALEPGEVPSLRRCGGFGQHRVVSVLAAGFGFVRISRGAIEKMHRTFASSGSYWDTQTGFPVVDLFSHLRVPSESFSGQRPGMLEPIAEDVSFFLRAREAGVSVEAFVDLEVVHDHRTRDGEGRTFAEALGAAEENT